MLDKIVEPEDALSLSEIEVIELKQTIRTKSLEILQRKAGLLAKLKEIIDHETLLQSLDSYFTEMTEAINNLVSEVYNNRKILGREATEELIEEILNLLYFDPEKDGDLINKLEAKLAKLSQNSYQLEKPLNLFPRDQLALISDEGNKLEQFKERVQAALERNNYEELKGLIKEISALKIMQVCPRPSSPLISEREAYELRVEYDKLNYQAILITEGGNTLEKFKERVQAALERSDDKEQLEKKQLEDLVRELEGLVQEIFALKIMQVYPRPSSPLISEREAYELKVEYKRMIEMIGEAQIKLRLRKLRSST